jgi:hypothetical protein
LQNDIEALRELLATYEQSIQRKDQVISNLTAGLQHHRNRMEMQRTFSEWKIKHNDARREVCRIIFAFDFAPCFNFGLLYALHYYCRLFIQNV